MNVNQTLNAATLGKVAVLLGGRSAEREVSLMSGNGVLAALRAGGVDALPFDPAERDLHELKTLGVQRCFIALHGRWGEDGTVQGALELLGIPYSGSGVLASAIAIDKVMTKRIWLALGLSTPQWREASSAEAVAQAFAELGQPMIVKPAREGSTLGLSKVRQASECQAAYTLAAGYDPQVLCEQMIVGEEVTCAILGQGEQAQALPLIRIVAPDGNYDFNNKYYGTATQYLVPSGLPASEETAIQALALAAYRAIGCRGWGRADVMIDAQSRKPYLLEINTAPGMTGHSLVPLAARAAGLSYEALCLQVVASARLDHSHSPSPRS